MPRIEPVELETVEPRARDLLDDLGARGTEPGPMVRAMANAPALLRGYLDLSRAMKRSHAARSRLLARADRRGARPGGAERPDRRVQPGGRHSPDDEREERRMINRYTAWAAAVGAAGCGRCAAAA
jgi:hypothetical protein